MQAQVAELHGARPAVGSEFIGVELLQMGRRELLDGNGPQARDDVIVSVVVWLSISCLHWSFLLLNVIVLSALSDGDYSRGSLDAGAQRVARLGCAAPEAGRRSVRLALGERRHTQIERRLPRARQGVVRAQRVVAAAGAVGHEQERHLVVPTLVAIAGVLFQFRGQVPQLRRAPVDLHEEAQYPVSARVDSFGIGT